MAKDLVYLVTGGCGYIGEHIVRLLATEDYVKEVRVLYHTRKGRELEKLSTATTTVTLVKGDVTDYNQVLKAIEGVHVVIHTAALLDYFDQSPYHKMEAINVGGTEHVINACLASDVTYIVFTGSIAAVGPNKHNEPMFRGTEETFYTGEQGMPYGKTKAQAEKLIRAANGRLTNHGKTLTTCVIRPSNIYGEKTSSLLDGYVSAKSKNYRIAYIEPENLDQNYTYVGNVAWMHVLAARQLQMKPELLGGQVYYPYDDTPVRQRYKLLYELYTDIDPRIQLGSHVPYWQMWLIISIFTIFAFLVRPFYTLKPFLTLNTLNFVVTTFSYETDKAFRHFGYQPKYSWMEAKIRTCKWIKNATESL
ncbi:3 beta-hydroxysteroid dehydrogenase type 7-like isoform X1 [Pelobates fuscus]|uniref:3 beta-hydroxysteroid dehydrogenase type 7-like isoform X1 n=1 Tax=Pelobates fuscus TaxID=191477 RepID=UPI002FE42F04